MVWPWKLNSFWLESFRFDSASEVKFIFPCTYYWKLPKIRPEFFSRPFISQYSKIPPLGFPPTVRVRGSGGWVVVIKKLSNYFFANYKSNIVLHRQAKNNKVFIFYMAWYKYISYFCSYNFRVIFQHFMGILR